MAGINHVGIVVDNLEEAIRFASRTFGLTVERRAAVPERQVATAFLRWGGIALELIEHNDPQLRAERLGDATARIDHIAVEVENLDAYVTDLHARGIATLTPGPIRQAGRHTIFTDPKTTDGVTYQFLEVGERTET
jgi:methylmalonyl-CoA/ethylmalonyl-CoA epimerase